MIEVERLLKAQMHSRTDAAPPENVGPSAEPDPKKCQHANYFGDNYGATCADCGEVLRGYGRGGFMGLLLKKPLRCVHFFMKNDDESGRETCLYCERERPASNQITVK